MNNNHRITLNTNKNIIVEFTNERIIPCNHACTPVDNRSRKKQRLATYIF